MQKKRETATCFPASLPDTSSNSGFRATLTASRPLRRVSCFWVLTYRMGLNIIHNNSIQHRRRLRYRMQLPYLAWSCKIIIHYLVPRVGGVSQNMSMHRHRVVHSNANRNSNCVLSKLRSTNHSVMLLGACVAEFSQYSSPSRSAYSRPSYFYSKNRPRQQHILNKHIFQQLSHGPY